MSSTNHYRKFFKSYTEPNMDWSEIQRLCGGRYERKPIYIEVNGYKKKQGDEYIWVEYRKVKQLNNTDNDLIN